MRPFIPTASAMSLMDVAVKPFLTKERERCIEYSIARIAFDLGILSAAFLYTN